MVLCVAWLWVTSATFAYALQEIRVRELAGQIPLLLDQNDAKASKEESQALLDPEGRQMWRLFPSSVEEATLEAIVPPQSDFVGFFCAPEDYHDPSARWIYNVASSALLPMIVDVNQSNRKDAAVVVLPGGGHNFLAWNKEGTEIGEWLNHIGISAFILKYEVPEDRKKHPLSLRSVQRAVSVVRSKTTELQLNVSKIGVIGFSAGGGLSTELVDTPAKNYDRIDDADDFSHTPDFQLLIYGAGGADQNGNSSVKPPPTFIAHAANDVCVHAADAMKYYSRALNAGSRSELHVYPDGGHGYGLCRPPHSWHEVCTWPDRAEEFLKRWVLHESEGT